MASRPMVRFENVSKRFRIHHERARSFQDLLISGFISMLIFVGILLLGLAYAWRKGVLEWR